MIVNLVRDNVAQSTLSIDHLQPEHLGHYDCTSEDKTNAKYIVKFKDARMSRDQPRESSRTAPTNSAAQQVPEG